MKIEREIVVLDDVTAEVYNETKRLMQIASDDLWRKTWEELVAPMVQRRKPNWDGYVGPVVRYGSDVT